MNRVMPECCHVLSQLGNLSLQLRVTGPGGGSPVVVAADSSTAGHESQAVFRVRESSSLSPSPPARQASHKFPMLGQ